MALGLFRLSPLPSLGLNFTMFEQRSLEEMCVLVLPGCKMTKGLIAGRDVAYGTTGCTEETDSRLKFQELLLEP